MEHLKDLHVLILGLGSSGLAMARWCAAQDARVTVADTRAQPPGLQALVRDVPAAQFRHVQQWSADLVEGTDFRAVCRSPGLSPSQIAPVLGALHAMGVQAWGELDLFWMGLQSLKASQQYEPQVLAISGTNGKTTVTSLTGQLVERAGKTVALAGNIGPTLLDTLSAKMAAKSLPQVWVLELSSFQ
ncbi:MAG: Mur ligase family protein, partial [Brachymonas sp.]